MSNEVRGITIDPPGSRDLDDAVWLDEDGTVTVSVAAVGLTVTPGDGVAEAARRRGFTRYYAEGTLPMLPRELAEDALSLLPGVGRDVLCVRMRPDVDDDCELSFGRLTSEARYTYAGAAEAVSTGAGPHAAMLGRLSVLAHRLLAARRAAGALAFYDLHHGYTVTEEGELRRLHASERATAYVIIQELMILANYRAARLLAREGVAALYRNHEARGPGRRAYLRELGAALDAGDVTALWEIANGARRQMQRARYGPRAAGHYGLNLPAYMHLTSPIRRYADLVCHWAVSAYLERGERQLFPDAALEATAAHLYDLTTNERAATSRHLRRKAMTDAGESLGLSAEQLDRAGDPEFYRMLRVAQQRAEVPEAFAAALVRRARADRLTDKEAVRLLLPQAQQPREGAWAAVRAEALEMLRRNPHRAVSVLALAQGLVQWPAVEYESESRAAVPGQTHTMWHSVTARVTPPGRDAVAAPTQLASSIRAAKQRAAVALIYTLAGVRLPAEYQAEANEPSGLPAPPQAVAVAAGPPVKPGLAAVTAKAGAGDYISALLEYASKRHERHPQYVFDPPGAGGVVTCHAYLPTPEIEETGTGQTKKEAKHAAARAVYERLAERERGAAA